MGVAYGFAMARRGVCMIADDAFKVTKFRNFIFHFFLFLFSSLLLIFRTCFVTIT